MFHRLGGQYDLMCCQIDHLGCHICGQYGYKVWSRFQVLIKTDTIWSDNPLHQLSSLNSQQYPPGGGALPSECYICYPNSWKSGVLNIGMSEKVGCCI